MKKVAFLTLFIFITITSCISPPLLNNIEQNNYQSKASIELQKQHNEHQQKIIELFKNKKKFSGNIEVSINTNLVENNFSTKSNSNVRKKVFLLGNHPINQSHINTGEHQIFDPSNAESLNGLSAYEGDYIDINTNFRMSSVKINGTDELNFENDVILLELTDKAKIGLFRSLYNAEILDELNDYYKLRVDINKAPIQKLGELLQEYNNYIPVNITSIEFSSLASMKTFTIVLDFFLNNKDIVKNIILDAQPLGLPFIPNDFYKDGIIGDPNNSPKDLPWSGWWLNETDVPFAWDLSIGTDVTIAWLETNGFLENHPEVSRRVIDFGDNNASDSLLFAGTSIVPSTSYLFSPLAALFGEGQLYHGSYALMTCCAERNNDIRTVGVAPNVKVAPYSFQGIFSMAAAVNRARKHNVGVIGINQDFTTFVWGLSAIGEGSFTNIKNILSGVGPAAQEIEYAYRINKIPVVVAAHNFAHNVYGNPLLLGLNNYFPASSPFVITVGYVVPETCNAAVGECTSFKVGWEPNNTGLFGNGDGSNYGKAYMVWAPGGSIDLASFNPNISSTYPFGGTSAATPFTAGVIALMKSRNPQLTAQQIEDILYFKALSTKFAAPHENMKKDGFTSFVKLINVQNAVREAIKLKTTNKDPDAFKATIFDIAYFDGNNKKIKFNNGDEGSYIDSLSTVEFNSINGKLVKLTGWASPVQSGNDKEILSAEIINRKPNITSTNIVNIMHGTPIEIRGTDLYGPNGHATLSFIDSSNKEYFYKIANNQTNFPDNKGSLVKFNFDKDKTLNSANNKIPAGHYTKVRFLGTNGTSTDFSIGGTTGFRVTNAAVKENIPFGTRVSYNGQQVPVIPTQSGSQPLQLKAGDLFGIGIHGINEIGLENIKVYIGEGVEVTLKNVIDDYVIAGVPGYLDNHPGTYDVIIKIVFGSAELEPPFTIEEAIEVIRTNLQSGDILPRPQNDVVFNSGMSNQFTVKSDKFISPGNTVQVNSGDIVAIGMKPGVNLDNIRITMGGGVILPLKGIVENYMAFGIPENIPPGVESAIISIVNTNESITIQQAIKILSGQLLSPKIVFVSNRDGNQEVYTMNEDGTDQKRITYNNVEDYYPVLSPDGRKIAYVSDWQIHVMNIDGTNDHLIQLPNDYALSGMLEYLESEFVWMPDSTDLIYMSSNEDKIYKVRYDGTNRRIFFDHSYETLGNQYYWFYGLCVSPDGKKILALGFELGTSNYGYRNYVFNSDGSGLRKLTDHNRNAFHELGYWISNNEFIYDPGSFEPEGYIIEKVDLNSNVQKINLGTYYWPNRIKASKSGRVGYMYHEWEFKNSYIFRDYSPDFSSFREYDLNFSGSDNNNVGMFDLSFNYDKYGTKIIFDSDLPYTNQSYRILNNNDTSEIYTMNLNSGIISRLTNNSFFDGYSSLLSSELNEGFGISSNSNRKLKAIKRYKERHLPRLKKRQENFEKFKKSRKK